MTAATSASTDTITETALLRFVYTQRAQERVWADLQDADARFDTAYGERVSEIPAVAERRDPVAERRDPSREGRGRALKRLLPRRGDSPGDNAETLPQEHPRPGDNEEILPEEQPRSIRIERENEARSSPPWSATRGDVIAPVDATVALQQIELLYAAGWALAWPEVIGELAASPASKPVVGMTSRGTLYWNSTAFDSMATSDDPWPLRPFTARPPRPRLLQLRLESPFEVLAQVPPEYLAGGGLTAMLALATHVGTFPIRLAEKWSEHGAKKSEYDLQRTRNERLMLQEQALMIRARANRLAVTEVEVLDPDDSSAPLVEIASREPEA